MCSMQFFYPICFRKYYLFLFLTFLVFHLQVSCDYSLAQKKIFKLKDSSKKIILGIDSILNSTLWAKTFNCRSYCLFGVAVELKGELLSQSQGKPSHIMILPPLCFTFEGVVVPWLMLSPHRKWTCLVWFFMLFNCHILKKCYVKNVWLLT